MQKIITQMLSKYQINNMEDKKNAMKEIVQESFYVAFRVVVFLKRRPFMVELHFEFFMA